MANPSSFWQYTTNDHNAKASSALFAVYDLTVAGALAVNLPKLGTLEAALDAIVDGVTIYTRTTYNVNEQLPRQSAAPDANSSRKRKFLYRYEDTVTGNVYSTEIPTAKVSIMPNNGRTVVNLRQGSSERVGIWDAFADAAEAIAISPDSNSIASISAEFVTRDF